MPIPRRSRLPFATMVFSLSGAACLGAQQPAPGAEAEAFAAWFAGQRASLEQLYQDLHQKPELSLQERSTAARLQAELEAAGFAVTGGVGGTGVVGVLANGDGPVVLLRADLDGLPIAEATGLPYASTVRGTAADGTPIGTMHACGHDLHMSCLVGAARRLHQLRDQWRGTVVCIGQPAEERALGARAMLGDGLFTRFPKPDFCLALHCEPGLPSDQVGWCAGPLMAAVDSVDVTLRGRGGHGAAPHKTVDPIVLAAQFVLALQTIVSRELDPLQPAVVTVGSIHAGSKHNIIPDRAQLQLTVRTYDEGVRAHIRRAIVQKAESLSQLAGAPAPTVEFSEPMIALQNDPALTARIAQALAEALGQDRVVTVKPQMIAEDFAMFGSSGVPICMFRLGTTARENLDKPTDQGGPHGLHTAGFAPDMPRSLATGIFALTAAARSALQKP